MVYCDILICGTVLHNNSLWRNTILLMWLKSISIITFFTEKFSVTLFYLISKYNSIISKNNPFFALFYSFLSKSYVTDLHVLTMPQDTKLQGLLQKPSLNLLLFTDYTKRSL